MTDFEKLPARVQNIITKCRRGEKLTKSLRLKETGETEISFAFEPSGKRAPPKSSIDAINSGLLRPLGDGLFGADTSQTFAAAD
jgi:hypothetical protein